jgi:hypothetical protein
MAFGGGTRGGPPGERCGGRLFPGVMTGPASTRLCLDRREKSWVAGLNPAMTRGASHGTGSRLWHGEPVMARGAGYGTGSRSWHGEPVMARGRRSWHGEPVMARGAGHGTGSRSWHGDAGHGTGTPVMARGAGHGTGSRSWHGEPVMARGAGHGTGTPVMARGAGHGTGTPANGWSRSTERPAAEQTCGWRCPSISHRPNRGDRGCPCCRCPEPDAGVWTPELCPYRLNNRLGWDHCVHVPSCPASVQHGPLKSAPCFFRTFAIVCPLQQRHFKGESPS